MDKLTLKRLFAERGDPPGRVRRGRRGRAGASAAEAMGLPLWVKPSRLGSSVGISRVERPRRELDAAVELALRHDPRVIVEASADGREVECSVLGNERALETSLPGEIVANADWYDYEAKYARGRHGAGRPGADLREVERRPRPRARRRGLRASPAAPASPAATSSSSPTARSWSTRSTRCPASPRPASTRSCCEAERHLLRRPLRPPRRARRRAPRGRAHVRVLRRIS